jgi:hypothetical protein
MNNKFKKPYSKLILGNENMPQSHGEPQRNDLLPLFGSNKASLKK